MVIERVYQNIKIKSIKIYFFILIRQALAITSISYGVKVNMHGSVSFGKDVLNILGMYLRKNDVVSRRTQPFTKETDTLYLLTKYTYLCRGLPFCEGDMETYINEYITLLTKAVEAALNYLTNDTSDELKTNKKHVFEKPLHKILYEIKKLLRATNMVVNEKNEHYMWKEVIKRICAMFQETAEEYSNNNLDISTDSDVIKLIKKKMTQKIVIATTTVESTFAIKLCIDHDICPRTYECTKSINTMFGVLENLELDKIKVFIKHFSKELLDTRFYSYVGEATANQLQITFDEIAYSGSAPIKEVFHHFHLIVEAILHGLKFKQYFTYNRDVDLVHVVLSDMDHFYENQKVDPFHIFLSNFFDWVRLGKDIKQPIQEVLADISIHINQAAVPLRMKLIREVKVYLELLGEPDF